MSDYHPIDCGVPLQASLSDLASLHWSTNGLTLDFFLPDDEAHLLRVSFDRQCIIRVLDEMALSTEETETPEQGLVSDHFAYRLEGSAFARTQSSNWKDVNAPVTHYRFVTGWACVDVLTAAAPVFAVVPRQRADASETRLP